VDVAEWQVQPAVDWPVFPDELEYTV